MAHNLLFVGPFVSERNSNYGSEEQIGAIEQQIFQLSVKLTKMSYNVNITRNFRDSGQNTLDGVNFFNVTTLPFSWGYSDSPSIFSRISYFIYLLKVIILCNVNNFNIVCFSGIFESFFVGNLIFNDVKKVYIIHNNDVLLNSLEGHSKYPAAIIKMLKNIENTFSLIISTTPLMSKYLRKFNINCDEVIYEHLNINDFKTGEIGNYILSAQRLVPHKRVLDLISAYSKIRDEIPQKLIIIGEGPCKKELIDTVNRMNLGSDIKFMPFLSKSLYKTMLSNCSFFVLPSIAEAFGVVLIEAMASKKGVLARNILGPKDIITHSEDGYLFNTDKELVYYLKKMSIDKNATSEMGKKGYYKALTKFNIEETAKQYDDIFKKCLYVCTT